MKSIAFACIALFAGIATADNAEHFKLCQADNDCDADYQCQQIRAKHGGMMSLCQPRSRQVNLNVNWVVKPAYQLQGPILAKRSDIRSLDNCFVACVNLDRCAAITFYKNRQLCVLHTRARNYIRVVDDTNTIRLKIRSNTDDDSSSDDAGRSRLKARASDDKIDDAIRHRSRVNVGKDAVLAIRHGYSKCYANANIQLDDKTINFAGTFQDCSKCVSSHKTNAFAWLMNLSTTESDEERVGTCICKSMGTPAVKLLAATADPDNKGFILCVV